MLPPLPESSPLFAEDHAEEERQREGEEYLRCLTESSLDCIKTLELDGTILSISESGLRLLEIGDASTVCGKNWATFFWDHEETREAFFAARDIAVAGGTGRFQGYCPTITGKPMWWDVVIVPLLDADGKPEKLLSTSRDITALREAERVAERAAREARLITDAVPLLISYIDTELIYRFANKTYAEWFRRPITDFLGKRVEDIVGPAAFAQIRPRLMAVLSGERVSYEGLMPYQGAGHRYVDIKLVPDVAEDGASVRGYVAVVTDISERKLMEQERERLLISERSRAERESLLNQIGNAARTMVEPETFLLAAVAILGEGLGVDRCYFVRTDLARDTTRVHPEWLRKGAELQPFAGQMFRPSSYAVNRNVSYQAGQTHVIHDVDTAEDAASLLALGIRSLVRVPINVGVYGTGLTVAMARDPRVWSEDEVQLVENVAALVRSALDSAQVQQRERNISQRLQDALIPPPPTNLPGLALASYYRPALSEAQVGGDFFDVYPVREGCTALVVADLSGKGLSAASEVATVRNMLRYAVYRETTIAEAMTGLHRSLVNHELLTGFATLFLAVYDEKEQTLTYVNAGQESGLLWRSATGMVEQLSPTGPVLGGFGEGNFEERTVTLSAGDVLALFTDGLTEVGPSRKIQLDIDGVSDFLRDCCDSEMPGATHPWSVIESLISSVDAFARGGVRDDIALLVGVVGKSDEDKPGK